MDREPDHRNALSLFHGDISDIDRPSALDRDRVQVLPARPWINKSELPCSRLHLTQRELSA